MQTLGTVVITGGASGLGAASAYSASKFGVVGFTRALALDLAAGSESRCSVRAG